MQLSHGKMDAPADQAEHEEDASSEEDDQPGVLMPARWSQRYRLLMVQKMLATLTIKQVDDIRAGEDWPNDPGVFNKAYTELYVLITDELKLQYPGYQSVANPKRTDYRPFRDAAVKWTTRFLLTGTIHDRPPHEKGYKMQQRKPHLAQIRDMIMKGFTDSQGNVRLFRDLHHLQREKKGEFTDVMKATGLKTMESLWKQLQQVYPALGQVPIKIKKEREAKEVQVCCSALLVSHSIPSYP